MIRTREATMLAFTKLRTRKVRLVVTVVISGLLFSVLAGASIGARGVFSSIGSLNKEGLANRYIANGFGLSSGNFYMNEKIIDRAVAINKETVDKKKAEAKKLGIEYTAESEQPPFTEYPGPNGAKSRNLNPMHPAAVQAITEDAAANPVPGFAAFKKTAAPYNASAFYESRGAPYDQSGGRLLVLQNGKESFDATTAKFTNGPPKGLDSFATSWTLMSEPLLKPFILPGQNLSVSNDGSIPIIIPVSAAEQLLGMKTLTGSASAGDRLERTRTLRDSVKGLAFSVCYRNAASAELVSKAVAAQKEIEANKNKKDYVKPDLQYGLPAEACTVSPVIRDVRTAAQKTLDAKQQQFDQLFGATPAAQSKVQFHVVGLVPDADYEVSTSVSQIAKSLVTSSLGNGWYAPMDEALKNPTVARIFDSSNPTFGSSAVFYAEFSSADSARKYIDGQNCSPNYQNYDPSGGIDPTQACLDEGKPFALSAFGSNSLGLESAKKSFAKIFMYVGLGIAVVASIIMMGTVGKMIADSRRETAVFRAIGAKKLDIAQIYILYTIFLSLLIFAFALSAGFIGALIADNKLGAELTQQALVAYNAQNLDQSFKLYALYLPDMAYLLGITLAAGLLSALFPLIRSLRRNPIRDMRDDT